MITVPEVVEELVKHSPFIEEGLKRKLINLSSLARELQPQIQERLLKDIKLGAVVMALKRLERKIEAKDNSIYSILSNLGDITVRSNIITFTFHNSPTIYARFELLLSKTKDIDNSFLTFTEGVFEVSLFASKNLEKEIEKAFRGERLKNKITNLSSITIIIPEEATQVPGVYYSILKVLAWEGINFVEVLSSYTELTIFLEEKTIDRAFSALKKIR